MELPATVTPATREELRNALERALPGAPRRTLDYLTAHVFIETGNGKHMVQHNVGMLHVPRSQIATRDHWRPEWFAPGPDASETILFLHRGMLAGTQPEAFAAFPDLNAGAEAFAALVSAPRYRPLLEARSAADYVRAWRDTGYTPDLDVARTLQTFKRMLPEEQGSHDALIAWAVIGTVGALLARAILK